MNEKGCGDSTFTYSYTINGVNYISYKNIGGLTESYSVEFDGNGYKLNYGAKMGEWTLAEGLAMWQKKYGAELETK